uniref:Transposable element Tc1 transposase n=1 Tax=Bactrocera latifrons TaxID=174628 RepID=A0A0K8VI16_BACLA
MDMLQNFHVHIFMNRSAEKLGIENEYYFQHDNDPKHTAGIVRLWVLYNTPHTLKTPPQSPDLNPIKHLWDHLDRRVRGHHITSKTTLKEILWKKTSSDVTKKLVHSIQKRLQEVIKNNGKHTTY